MKVFFRLGLFILAFTIVLGCHVNKQSKTIQVLLLSGSNNHEWQSTSPFLKKMYTESGLFEVQITEKPDTLKGIDLAGFDVVVSNWNSWPENELRWPSELENALIEFVKSGGGFVTFHASTSAFYKWPEFKNISTAAWIDSTWHGQNSDTKVLISNKNHPITEVMNDFTVFDELWVNAEINESFDILGYAKNNELDKKGIHKQPAIMVKQLERGRIFHTILGHDVKAMKNEDFQELFLRGTEWAASRTVKYQNQK